MAYNATYSTSDMSSIIVDILGSAGAQIVQWVGIIVLLGIVVFLMARLKKLGSALPK